MDFTIRTEEKEDYKFTEEVVKTHLLMKHIVIRVNID